MNLGVLQACVRAWRTQNMEFLVSWKGYSQKDDTWEPYKAVYKTQAFVDYCYANKLKSLVNKTPQS